MWMEKQRKPTCTEGVTNELDEHRDRATGDPYERFKGCNLSSIALNVSNPVVDRG